MDLLDNNPIPGLRTQAQFVSAEEEQELISHIDSLDMAPFRFQQWTGKRLSKSFGWHYDFQLGTVSRADALPDWLLPLRARAAAFAGLEHASLAQVLLLKYGPGAGINWHRDRPQFEHVLGLSLGAFANMRFRRKRAGRWERVTLPLDARTLYQLSGEVRHEWEHSIAPMTEGTRYSITFRSLSDAGRRIRSAP